MFLANFSRCVIVLASAATFAFSQSASDPNNMLKNGTFDTDYTGWLFQAVHGAKGAGKVVDGQMVCASTAFGEGKFFYDVQFLQNNLTIENNVTYFLSFDAKAAANRPITVNVETTHGEQQFLKDLDGKDSKINLTTSMQTFAFTFKMTAPTNNALRLNFNVGETLDTVYLDNILLIDKSKMTAVRPQSDIRAESGNSRISADSRGLSFSVSDPAHFGYQIYSAAGRLVADYASLNQRSAAQYRINYQSLGITPGMYVVRALDGNQRYSQIVSMVP
jgi:hypothetical protein